MNIFIVLNVLLKPTITEYTSFHGKRLLKNYTDTTYPLVTVYIMRAD